MPFRGIPNTLQNLEWHSSKVRCENCAKCNYETIQILVKSLLGRWTGCIMQMSYLYASDFPFKTFRKLAQQAETTTKNVWEKFNDACSSSIRVQTPIIHISICFSPQHQRHWEWRWLASTIHLRATGARDFQLFRPLFLRKIKFWSANYSACVVYTKTIIHLSVGERDGYLPPLRWIIVKYSPRLRLRLRGIFSK